MYKVPSFQVDHTDLPKGIYLSRVDEFSEEKIVTLDVRFCQPYKDIPLTSEVAHALEHMVAVAAREVPLKLDDSEGKVIYVGIMGCLTGMYIIFSCKHSDLNFNFVSRWFDEVIDRCLDFDSVPAATREECGNYRLMDYTNALMALLHFRRKLRSGDLILRDYPKQLNNK